MFYNIVQYICIISNDFYTKYFVLWYSRDVVLPSLKCISYKKNLQWRTVYKSGIHQFSKPYKWKIMLQPKCQLCLNGPRGIIAESCIAAHWDIYLVNDDQIIQRVRYVNSSIAVVGFFFGNSSIPWLSMPWLPASPVHYQPWYLLFGINAPLFHKVRDFNHLHFLFIDR